MMRRSFVVMLMVAHAPLVARTPPGPAPVVAGAAEGTLIASEPYRFRFPTRTAWLAGWQGRPNGRDTASAFGRLFSEADYAGWALGRTTRTSTITYRSGGIAVRGLLVEPRAAGRNPVVIYNHGGMGRYGAIVFWDVLELNRLAQRGYLELASQFRGEGGSAGRPDVADGDADDALALIQLAERLPNADATRLGMWGFSRGGMTSYVALTRSDRIAAAVIESGPVDLVDDPRRNEFDRFVYPGSMPDYRADPEAALARRSPIRWPERLSPRTAVLLLQGGDDPRVRPSGTLAMAQALQRLRRPYRLKVYEGAGHDLFEDFADARVEIDRWFDRYVRDGVAPRSNGVSTLPPDATGAP